MIDESMSLPRGKSMRDYHHVLLALQFDSNTDEKPIQKASDVAKELGAKLTLIHAIEHMSSYGAAYGVAAGADIEEMLMDLAKEEMAKTAKQLGVSIADCIIKVGPAKVVILEEAERLEVDLIVVGSHGRHGLRLLLGSTANAVLHGASCDVLAVRLKED